MICFNCNLIMPQLSSQEASGINQGCEIYWCRTCGRMEMYYPHPEQRKHSFGVNPLNFNQERPQSGTSRNINQSIISKVKSIT
jgi:hypothetical protein